MNIFNYIKIAIFALIQNKARTFLTLLGIVIGISSVIAIMALSEGATSSVTSQFNSLGTNNITVSPGAQTSSRNLPPGAQSISGSSLTLDKDVLNVIQNKLDKNTYDYISPTLSSSFSVSYKEKNSSGTFVGIGTDYFQATSVNLSSGRLPTSREIGNGSKVIIISEDLNTKLFGNRSAIDQSLIVDSTELKIIGILKSSGFGGGQNLVPLEVMQNNLAKKDTFSSIAVVAQPGKTSQVQSQLKQILFRYYDISSDDEANFSISNSQSILDTATSITTILSGVLVAVASISLLVGGIGIMNIMLVTVSERTKEIGLRKALGATIGNILIQFLLESVLVSLLGGVIGIGLGWLISTIGGNLFGVNATVTLTAILLATGISSVIGVIFGFYPAYKAARMQPIDALRYE